MNESPEPTAWSVMHDGGRVVIECGTDGAYIVYDQNEFDAVQAFTFEEATEVAREMLEGVLEIRRLHQQVRELHVSWKNKARASKDRVKPFDSTSMTSPT